MEVKRLGKAMLGMIGNVVSYSVLSDGDGLDRNTHAYISRPQR